MTEYDWIKKLIREPVDQNTLNIFGDWLEERGDKRSEVICKSGVKEIYPISSAASCWKIVFPIMGERDNLWFGSEETARKELINRIVKYFLWTDEE